MAGAVYGAPIQGLGNAAYFGDPYEPKQYLTDIVIGGVVGGVSGAVANWINKARATKAAQALDDVDWSDPVPQEGGGRVQVEEPIPTGVDSPDGIPLNKFAGLEFETTGTVEGTKLISQFSSSTIDDAVGLAMRDGNKLRHLFPAKHNLGPLVNKLGGQENTIRAVLNAANGKLPASGVFNNIPVNVSGQTIFLRGNVINGVPRIGTMFIP